MRPLSAQDIICIWEDGQSLAPAGQALAILARACPERTVDELARLSIGERDARLLALREATFGPRLDGFAACPRCRESLEFALHSPDLRVAPVEGSEPNGADGADGSGGAYSLASHGYEVRFRLLTSDDLAAAARCADEAQARALLVARCVLAAEEQGQLLSPAALPEAVVAALAARLAECDPQAEIVLNLDCPACGNHWPALLEVASFFWAELRTLAKRLLREVHTLALAYGWREADILAMSAWRRQSYLELVGA